MYPGTSSAPVATLCAGQDDNLEPTILPHPYLWPQTVKRNDDGTSKDPSRCAQEPGDTSTMDITKFVVSSREKALLYGDYATYRSQLAGKLLNCRKKLNIVTKSRGKFNPKIQVTAAQIAENHEYVRRMPAPVLETRTRNCGR